MRKRFICGLAYCVLWKSIAAWPALSWAAPRGSAPASTSTRGAGNEGVPQPIINEGLADLTASLDGGAVVLPIRARLAREIIGQIGCILGFVPGAGRTGKL